MNDDEIREGEVTLEPTPDDEPRIFAMKRRDDLWRMDKRAFLKSMALGTVAGVIGCSESAEDIPDDDSDDSGDSIPPFDVGGISYRLIDLRDYNGTLPPSGRNLAVVAYVQSDFYFRYFDGEGNHAVNVHESNVSDQTAVGEIKSMTQTIAARGNASPSEQVRINKLFTAVRNSATGTGETVSGRRMQGTAAQTESGGRRMQGTIPSGPASGRRLQGAEGRAEAGRPPRILGTLRINDETYQESRIVATYTDGQTKLSHAGGEIVVRTDALPELVHMQLPQPIKNPSPRSTAVPTQTTTTTPVPTPVRPSNPSPAPRSSTTGHYWRPN